eukprot:gnl/TRDRNA2_/TRDRNA2_89646_c0_seq1.p1 gnl/TRDRNA2_/TRDRNA2_89646_c0~~gnl/TRDRNA2_/TRDRNA2_89646_c0_seq1.p1  ORF type:complete len:217 (+),score=38.89 gnl/TRDRNA2_/TRDRNA2_89646_c0_seq1:170-820(+)
MIIFRNSFVLHDFVRMSYCYVHFMAPVLVLSLKGGCDGASSGSLCEAIANAALLPWYKRLGMAISGYFCWGAIYFGLIFILARERIRIYKRETLYKYVTIDLGYTEKLPKRWQKYSELVFMAGHFTLYLLGLPFLLFPMYLQAGVTAVVFIAVAHNGGRFYVDHFWKAYEKNTILYLDAACNAMAEVDGAPVVKSSSKSRQEAVDKAESSTTSANQ